MPHFTVAASEDVFKSLFAAVRDSFTFEKSDSADFGPFSAGYDVKLHLENGDIDLRAGNTVHLDELDIKWDQLDLWLGMDIPEICVGGFCIIPSPWGCVLRAPRICVFSADPDITVTLPLGGFTSEISMEARLVPKYYVNPDRPPGMNDWDAQDAVPPLYNQWRIHLDPLWVDIDPIDISDTVGDLLEAAVDAAIDGLLGWLPGWAKDLIRAILGPIIDLIRWILDIPDEIQEWISDLLNVSFGIIDLIGQFVLEYFAAREPLTFVEDPYPMLPEQTNPNGSTLPKLVDVKIPIRNLVVSNNDVEMVIAADVG